MVCVGVGKSPGLRPFVLVAADDGFEPIAPLPARNLFTGAAIRLGPFLPFFREALLAFAGRQNGHSPQARRKAPAVECKMD